ASAAVGFQSPAPAGLFLHARRPCCATFAATHCCCNGAIAMRQPPPNDNDNRENQPPEFAPRDLWSDDNVLREAVAREGGGAFGQRLAEYRAIAGGGLYSAGRDRPR